MVGCMGTFLETFIRKKVIITAQIPMDINIVN